MYSNNKKGGRITFAVFYHKRTSKNFPLQFEKTVSRNSAHINFFLLEKKTVLWNSNSKSDLRVVILLENFSVLFLKGLSKRSQRPKEQR